MSISVEGMFSYTQLLHDFWTIIANCANFFSELYTI